MNAAIGMELELYELEFHAFLFFFFEFDHPILNFLPIEFFLLKLDFNKIEFRKKGMNLSFKTGAYCQIFLKIGVKG